MRILAIDTSTVACSAAIIADDQLYERYRVEPRQHTQLIMPMINELLLESQLKLSDLDAIAFGCGPGSFTGLRIAAAICQGLAAGSDKPVVAISSMQAIAQRVHRELAANLVAVCLDARMNDVYYGRYHLVENGTMQPEQTERLIDATSFQPTALANTSLVGDGWSVINAVRVADNKAELPGILNPYYSSARDIALLAMIAYAQGLAKTPFDAMPVYLRDVEYTKL